MTQRYLQNIADQTISINIGGDEYRVRLYEFRGIMYTDIGTGKKQVVSGRRVLPNMWLLPEYEGVGKGNFRFDTYLADEEEYVHYKDFNTKYRFMVYGKNELAEGGGE